MISSKTARSKQTSRPSRVTTPKHRGAARKKTEAVNQVRRATRGKSAAERGRPPRKESKQQVCLALLCRAEGASIEELQEATGWQTHTVRGFLSGAVKRKLGLELASQKAEHQPRRYRILQATA